MQIIRWTVFACTLLLCGCGYRIGYLGHPQLKSIGIAPVTNDTLAYNLGPQVRTILAERFQVDGTMKLADEKKADCILFAKVVSYVYRQISWSSDTTDNDLQPNQWSVTLTISYSVMLPGQAAPFIREKQASGTAYFMSGPDLEVSRMYAIQQAANEAAKNIVVQVTEAW